MIMKWISSSELLASAVVLSALVVIPTLQSFCEAFTTPPSLFSSSVVRHHELRRDGCHIRNGRSTNFARPSTDTSLHYSGHGGQSSTSLVSPTPQSISSSLWSGSTLRFNLLGDAFDSELASSLSTQQGTESDEVLSYLDVELQQLPTKTRQLLARATCAFLDHERDPVGLQDILATIDEEYSSEEVPFSIGTQSFAERDKEMQQVGKILSFAALNRVPREITRQLLASLPQADGATWNVLIQVINEFDRTGWAAVSFPKGLSLRLKRRYLSSFSTRYSPLPRRTPLIGGRRNAIEEANVALEEAALATPPYRPMSREQFLESMNEAAIDSKSRLTNATEDEASDDLFFFKQQKRLWKLFTNAVNSQTERLKAAGRAGVISYGFLNFLWYTFAVVFQWRRVTARMAVAATTAAAEGAAAAAAGAGVVATAVATAPATTAAATTAPAVLSAGATLYHSLRKFGNVFLTVYVGSQVTKLPRLGMAVALAPFGDRMLRFTKRKLGVSEDRAFWILVSGLCLSCFGIWTSIIFADAITAKFMAAASSTTASTTSSVSATAGAGGMIPSTPGAIVPPLSAESAPPVHSILDGTAPKPLMPQTFSLEPQKWPSA